MRLFTDDELAILEQAGKILASKRAQVSKTLMTTDVDSHTACTLRQIRSILVEALRHYHNWRLL